MGSDRLDTLFTCSLSPLKQACVRTHTPFHFVSHKHTPLCFLSHKHTPFRFCLTHTLPLCLSCVYPFLLCLAHTPAFTSRHPNPLSSRPAWADSRWLGGLHTSTLNSSNESHPGALHPGGSLCRGGPLCGSPHRGCLQSAAVRVLVAH